jgi:hypothetical protein
VLGLKTYRFDPVIAYFSQVAENIQVLCLDADFCHALFRLAEGETVDAEKLVALGTAIQRDGKPVVPEAALIADLKDFAYRLINAWQDISPRAGDVPTAFTIFRDKIDQLATGETYAAKVAQSLSEVYQSELIDFRGMRLRRDS